MPCVLLLGARAPVAADIARSLAAAGARVVAADAWRWPPARWSQAVARYVRLPAPRSGALAFAAAVADLARAEGAGAIVPLCEEGYWLAAAVAAHPDLLPRGCRLVAPPDDVVRRLHDKAAFVAAARGIGLAVPATRLLSCAADLEDVLRARPPEALVFKPVWSRFATAVLVGAPAKVVRRRVRPTPGAPWVAQARVVGRGLCTYSVARDGEVVAHGAYRPDITYSGAAVVFEAVVHPAAEAWVRRLCASVGLTGQVSFDFIEGVAALDDMDEMGDKGEVGDARNIGNVGNVGDMTDVRGGAVDAVDPVLPEGGGPGALNALECNPRATSGAHLWHGGAALGEALLSAAGLVDPPADVVRPAAGEGAAIKGAVALAAPRWLGDRARRRRALLALRCGHDVFRRADDPGPGRAQPLAVAECVARALRAGVGVTDAMTADMRWDGEDVGDTLASADAPAGAGIDSAWVA